MQSETYWKNETYLRLKSDLLGLAGTPAAASTLRQMGTLDGDGIIFVSYDGAVHPGGLLPVDVGNVRNESLTRIYREDGLLRKIRAREIKGPCGLCGFREACGGSRARAYSHDGDPLSSDPACVHVASRSGSPRAVAASSLRKRELRS